MTDHYKQTVPLGWRLMDTLGRIKKTFRNRDNGENIQITIANGTRVSFISSNGLEECKDFLIATAVTPDDMASVRDKMQLAAGKREDTRFLGQTTGIPWKANIAQDGTTSFESSAYAGVLNMRLRLMEEMKAKGIEFFLQDIAVRCVSEATPHMAAKAIMTISETLLNTAGVKDIFREQQKLLSSSYMTRP